MIATLRKTARRLIAFMGPRWLVKDEIVMGGVRKEVDSRILYPLMAMQDTMAERIRLGMRATLPGFAPSDALPYIGKELDTIQGPSEPQESYEARLMRGIDDKRIAGIAWAMLEQIRGYCTPHAVRVRLVNEHGHWYSIDRDGTRSRYRNSAWEWDGAVPAAKTWTTTVITNAAGKTYTRSSGSFLDDRFKGGFPVYWFGFKDKASNGLKTIAAVTATTMTVNEAIGADEIDVRHTTAVGPNIFGGPPTFGRRIPWSRFWVLIYPTTGSPKQPWDRDGTWGDGEIWPVSTTTGTWGSTATTGDVQAIRTICTRWKSLGFHCMNILIVFNDAAFVPSDTSPPSADGTWADDGKYELATPGRKTRARNTDAIYWQGSS